MSTQTATCGEVRRHENSRFVCVAVPHPEEPNNHYFSMRDNTVGETGGYPSNAALESSLEAYFQSQVRMIGGMSLKMAPMRAGVPDRLVIFHGMVHFVELKTKTGSVSTIQLHRHSQMRKLGASVVVLRGQDEVAEWCRSIVEAAGPKTRNRAPRS